ncbi:BREX-1 system adenine-specific DNA-methyltransferase PglX [Mycobacterium sp. PSTR-4-N]|uniref:BREX-1 system adenine-specific DNA-methyltransferase PglX n=1 Tax=Mycobacterium sp. PSTR-4-N TaxID=2917745 RepID=UPI001F150344|nr:BREX-1 system adenine-specific DNA-methyltransferase PglX [Mycobacterium sp. PSTR-4-N]MCG7594582.1 BREX-1 system adenine-specific DNA-methyltransferase PglX [Mycobacterium sp. PSTR-4-N]
METASLKSFATWARTALIREVTARIAVVLAPASPARVEQSNVVAALERAVNAAGGGDKGRSAVADRVAYTWFNRIIALRFMDANGYTGIGVVSPQAGVDVGQPEILAEAKRANIDPEVVSQHAREIVAGLLNGALRSDDPQGEAYALLLAEYCRHWNRSMPFMFEREGDFTELLIPASLLADDSVLNRAVKVLTTDACQDVEVIGWLYQFYISERKDEVFAGFKQNQKAGAAEIPAATQLFTPHWIVRYLVENSLGRLWMLNHPTSRLVDQMQYYIAPVDIETEFLLINSPEDLKVIDPACGSGHMLTYAFDLLCAIYEEEGYASAEIPGLVLKNNLFGTEIDRRAGALAAFALTMKARARQRTFFTKQLHPNVCVLEPVAFTIVELAELTSRHGDRVAEEAFWNQFQHADIYGALIRPDDALVEPLQRHIDQTLSRREDLLASDLYDRAQRVLVQARYLSPTYHVTVANPPYMVGGNMNAGLSEFVKQFFPDSKADLFAAFIERNLSLSLPGGWVAMITMQSWLFLSSFVTLRRRVMDEHALSLMAHFGNFAFDTINSKVLSTTAFVIRTGHSTELSHGTYLRLVKGANESIKAHELRRIAEGQQSENRYDLKNAELSVLPGAVIAYWLSPAVRRCFTAGTPLAADFAAINGMTTGENARFLRLWYEISHARLSLVATSASVATASGAKWFPYNKGGGYRKWYGNAEFVINWEGDGRDVIAHGRAFPRGRTHYFEPMVSWGKVSSALPSFRFYPSGFIFDVAGTAMFTHGSGHLHDALAFCNSVVAEKLLGALSPTMNFESGQIASLPLIPESSGRVREICERLINISRDDWDAAETSWGFVGPAYCPVPAGSETKLEVAFEAQRNAELQLAEEVRRLEEENNAILLQLYELTGEFDAGVARHKVSISANPEFRFGPGKSENEYAALVQSSRAADLVSYAVGCMFGRYSLDKAGLILADQGSTLRDYFTEVPTPSFVPDADNVIPIVDGDWFEDDVVVRFRKFLRAAFGDQHFEQNLRFVTEAIGVKDLRDYFVKSFYKEHVQRYKKRPIYWLFSSPKGSFNALVYMHRYTPSTVSTVLNEYLREYKAKLGASLQHHERLAGGGTPREQAAALKEADRLRKVLLELEEYEHDVLYPLASKQIEIDLDDGVRVNYPKFGAALKKIPGLDVAE